VKLRVAVVAWIAVGSALAQNVGAPPAQPQQTGVVSSPRKINPDAKESANQRQIEGIVLDADKNPLPKAIVQLKDMKTLQIRSFITQADGTYRFAALKMDTDYELHATANDQNTPTKRVSSFESRKLVNINLQMEKK